VFKPIYDGVGFIGFSLVSGALVQLFNIAVATAHLTK
jgi:hypothetical protein